MENDTTKPLSKVIRIDESEIRGHLTEMVRGTIEETLNAMLDAEADEMCKAQRYEHSPDRVDTRAGHYKRKMHTQAGEVEVKMPKLRKQTFETAIIERYRRRDISIEEAIVQMYLAGVSVRRVEDVTEALWGTRVSSGTVSNLNKKVYKHLEGRTPVIGPEVCKPCRGGRCGDQLIGVQTRYRAGTTDCLPQPAGQRPWLRR